MDFDKFQKDFLSQLKSRNKKCLEIIENNKTLIQENFGDKASSEIIKNFVNEINNIIVEYDSNLISIIIEGDSNLYPFQNKYILYEKILKHPLFNRILDFFKNSDVLVKACKVGNKNAAKWLLTMDVNPCIQDEEGKTALMYAILHNLDFVIKPYLSDSQCMNIVDKNNENILFYCIRNSKYRINDSSYMDDYQNDIIFYSNIDINQTNSNGESVLTYCIKNNIIEPINKFLLNNIHIDVNIADNEGKTPAMYLTEKGLYSELFELHNKQCSYDYINLDGQSVMSILLDKLYSNSLSNVPYEQYIKIMSMFVDYQLDFNYLVDADENTAFMVMLLVNDLTTAKFCAENINKLDLSVKNKYGENATSLCYKLKHFELLPYFKNNPTFNYAYRDPINQNTLLMIAVHSPIAIMDLLENDPNIINEVNDKNENALILACKTNQIKSVNILLKYGIDINHQDNLGNTALYYAIEIRAYYLIHLLMMKNPDIHIKNNEGISAFDYTLQISDAYAKHGILSMIINPKHNFKDIKIKSQEIDKKYFEDFEKRTIPYANNYYSDFVSTCSMEKLKKEIYDSKSSKHVSKEIYVLVIVTIFVILYNILLKL
ncbi:ankyrin [Piromyces finnis]|uniref:Ankyrin n=1 Tax=Piromyces finnis TaxID=1754191 RepID=A0A1Y1UW02_9FUNG|nr:ankyrin [Piromyces finnis]|eukprot:ORX42205.1 ankyrin [Piromyces finnis]